MAKTTKDNTEDVKKAEELASVESSKIIEELIEKEAITEAIESEITKDTCKIA